MSIRINGKIIDDGLSIIFSFLTPSEIATCASRVNKLWHKISQASDVWNEIRSDHVIPYSGTDLRAYGKAFGLPGKTIRDRESLRQYFKKFVERLGLNQAARFTCRLPLQNSEFKIILAYGDFELVDEIAQAHHRFRSANPPVDYEGTVIELLSDIPRQHVRGMVGRRAIESQDKNGGDKRNRTPSTWNAYRKTLITNI